MNVETAISLPEDLLQTIDKLSTEYNSRSEFIETALRTFIAQITHPEKNTNDIELINQRADYLNQETLDAFTYQVSL